MGWHKWGWQMQKLTKTYTTSPCGHKVPSDGCPHFDATPVWLLPRRARSRAGTSTPP